MGKTAGTILTALFGLGFLLLLWFAFSDRTPTEKDRVVPQTKQQPSLPENDSDLGLLSTIDELQWRLEQAEAEISRLKKEKQNSVPNETEDKEWTKKAAGIGKKITINTSNGKISGISQGIDNDGALKIKTRNEIKKIYVGDVVLS